MARKNPLLVRRGFTLVELLVVISISGALMGILLPAIQAARESGRRYACNNNLKQLGLAVQQHQNGLGRLPAGVKRSADDGDPTGVAGFGWGAQLLPYLEEKDLHRRLALPSGELHDVLAASSRRYLAQIPLATFRCASDAGAPLNEQRPFAGAKYDDMLAATSNYVGNHGTRFVPFDKNAPQQLDSFGVLSVDSRLALDHIVDGAGKTILAGERHSDHAAGVWVGVRSYLNDSDSGLPMVLATSEARLNSRQPDGRHGFSSHHAGGAFFVFVDGHVEFLDDEIQFNQAGATSLDEIEKEQMGLYQRLLRRNDGLLLVAP